MFRCPSSRRSLLYSCSGPRRGGGRAPSSIGRRGAAPGSAPVVALDLARRAREAAFRRERSRAECSLFVWAVGAPRRRKRAGRWAPSSSAGSYKARAGCATAARVRPPARRGTGAVAPPSKVRGPRDASRRSRPDAQPPGTGGEGTRKTQRQKTYTLRSATRGPARVSQRF